MKRQRLLYRLGQRDPEAAAALRISLEPAFSLEKVRRDPKVIARFTIRLPHVGAMAAMLIETADGPRVRIQSIAQNGRWYTSAWLTADFEERVRSVALETLSELDAGDSVSTEFPAEEPARRV